MNLRLALGGLFAWTLGVLGCAVFDSLGQIIFFGIVALLGLVSIGVSVFFTEEE